MRPVRYDAEVRGVNLTEKRSMGLEHAKEAWDKWEIHCLILVSLSLQVFLSLTADLRRRSASRVLSTLVWLAYLSADTVAVFVLGHLAVHAQGPKHELMLFWAPFVLVHLGGQDRITAFSKQDNDLWTRHLLSLVTQTAVAGYVVSQSAWPDGRLRAAMVLMFLCGFLKYLGRTCCLYSASPKGLRDSSMSRLSGTLRELQKAQEPQEDAMSDGEEVRAWKNNAVKERFEVMFLADRAKETVITALADDIMLVDAPVDDVEITIAADELPDMLKEYRDMPERCTAYQYVARCLVESYLALYTKAPLSLLPIVLMLCRYGPFECLTIFIPVMLTFSLFQCISTVIALMLFASAHKEGHSKEDIRVSYILLVGAIVLNLQPAFTCILSFARKPFCPGTVVECAVMSGNRCLLPRGWLTRKQWSEELAQYSMTRRYSTSVENKHRCMPSIRKWILKCKPLGAMCAEFFDLTCTPVTDDLKLSILDKLLFLQTMRQEWDFASFRGERALVKWMGSHEVQEPKRSGYAVLHKSLNSRFEFPVSVLIWHIATDICYFSSGDKRIGIEPADETKKKMMSRELSRYIMYLVFKCDVMLTSNSRLVHKKVHEQLTEYFPQVHLDEKETVIAMFKSMKKEDQQHGLMQVVSQDMKMNDEAPANKNDAATSSGSGTQELLQRMVEALYSPVLPLARNVAQVLIDINNEAHRWELISEVWLEMLFYTAPRCGAAFHYEHLSTGGEFITHVLLLMRLLGPFMPKPAA